MPHKTDYLLWKHELAGAAHDGDPTQSVAGFWRIQTAKTKPDYPVAIYYAEDASVSESLVMQIGRQHPTTGEAHTDYQEFMTGTFPKCLAVAEDEYHSAMATGFWADGKPSRKVSEEEKLDIIPTTPSDEGGNAPVDEEGNPVDPFWYQIKVKLQTARDGLEALGKIDSEDKATKAAAFVDKLRAAGKLGEAKRVAEKEPHDTAVKAVQAKWVPVLQPASEAIKATVADIDAFQKAERARLQAIKDEEVRQERIRLQAIADEEARVERVRLQAIADENARVERLRRQAIADENARKERERLQAIADAEAEAAGKAAEIVEVQAEEVIVEAEQVVVEAEQVEVKAEVVEKPKVSAAYGRAVSKAVTRRGVIEDESKFIKAIKDGADFKEFLQDKANKLARAKTEVKGMRIVEE